jgi:voltage-gated potassium channel
VVSRPPHLSVWRLASVGDGLADGLGVHTARVLRWEQRAKGAVASRRVFPYLAATTASLAVLVGFVATLIDRKDFPTFGAGVWWAIVTLGTVGYGDIVPTTAWGRVLGGFVIVVGVTFISFLTATVTSYFVSVDQEAEQAKAREFRAASDNETRELLMQLDSRLAAIETALRTAPPD